MLPEPARGQRRGRLSAASILRGKYQAVTLIPTKSHMAIFDRGADGTLTTFDVADGRKSFDQGTSGGGINDEGQIAGYYCDSSYVAHGFFRDQSGNITEFDDPSAGTGEGQGTMPFAISNAGIIAGIYYDSNFTVHAFKRQ